MSKRTTSIRKNNKNKKPKINWTVVGLVLAGLFVLDAFMAVFLTTIWFGPIESDWIRFVVGYILVMSFIAALILIGLGLYVWVMRR